MGASRGSHGVGRAGVCICPTSQARTPRPKAQGSQWGIQVLRLRSQRGREAGHQDALKRPREDTPTTHMGDNQTEPLHPPG